MTYCILSGNPIQEQPGPSEGLTPLSQCQNFWQSLSTTLQWLSLSKRVSARV